MAAENRKQFCDFPFWMNRHISRSMPCRKEIPTATYVFEDGLSMAPKSMFGDVALNRIRKYAGRKNNIAATKPEVIVSQYAGS